MHKDFADKLVTALRSGNYKQGIARLRCNDEFCCLGVACEVAGIEAHMVANVEDDVIYTYNDRMDVLSDDFLKEIGMNSQDGKLNLSSEEIDYLFVLHVVTEHIPNTSLASLNDAGVDFYDIADIIENHWEEL